MIHVLVADRVPLFRCGIRAALESTPECKVVGEATERAGIIQLLLRLMTFSRSQVCCDR